MVQPVVAADPELDALALRDPKALEYAHVPIEVSRSVNGRQDRWAVLADLRRRGEATPVDVLMRCQPLPWITRQDRVELDIGGAQQRGIADRNTVWILRADRARND